MWRCRVTYFCAAIVLAIAGSTSAQESRPLPPVSESDSYYKDVSQPIGYVQAAPGLVGPVATGGCAPSPSPCCCGCCGCWPCQCPECPAPCFPCPRINLANPSWNLLIGGALEMDILFN